MKNKLVCWRIMNNSFIETMKPFEGVPAYFSEGGFDFVEQSMVTPRRATKPNSFVDAVLTLSIGNHHHAYLEYVAPGGFTGTFSYIDKTLQLGDLEKAATALKLKRFRFVDYSPYFKFVTLDPSKRYIVKPEGFSDGRMQFLFDLSKMDINHLVDYLDRKDYEGLRSQGVEFSLGAFESAQKTDDKESKTQEMFKEYAESNTDSASFFLMEKIENVDQEFRIITDHLGEPYIAVERAVVESVAGFQQATGILGHLPKIARGDAFEKLVPHGKEVRRLIKSMVAPMTGWDLYTTKDNKFGFFEYGVGWGCHNVPHADIVQEARSYLVHCANKVMRHTASF